MDQRAASMHSASDPLYWDALAALVRLYEEGNRKDMATQKLHSMQDFLAAHPNPRLSAPTGELAKVGEHAVSVSPDAENRPVILSAAG